MKSAKSLAEMRGDLGEGICAMEEIIGSVRLDEKRFLHLGTLSPASLIHNEAEHFGFDGYFLFETCDYGAEKGLTVMGKVPTLDAAFRLLEIWEMKFQGLN